MELKIYESLIGDIKNRIKQGQLKASLAVNAELILMYHDIGKMIVARQQEEGWGNAVIPQISRDIKNELAEMKGFSERNLGYMVQFAKAYTDISILQQLVAKLPWGHNIVLLQHLKDIDTRTWYASESLKNGWGRDLLTKKIKQNLLEKQGNATHNFESTLPAYQSDLAQETLKDPYTFDFLTLTETFNERELEAGLVGHMEKFLLELGSGFAFVGRQYHLTISDRDFYIDLLFYHLQLRCYIVIELKKGEFKPEYAGKMNFYCSAVDDLLRHKDDQPTIGLILCQTKDRIFAEYALKDIQKPIGISEYELTRYLPNELVGSLPSIDDLEKELENKQ
jgi:predicted nuclease of restriction endonuclease-like (RecB) superfamily